MPRSLDEEILLLQSRLEGLGREISGRIVEGMKESLESVKGRVLLLAEKAEETPSLIKQLKYKEKQLKEIQRVYDKTYAALISDTKKEVAALATELPPIIDAAYKAGLSKLIVGKLSTPGITLNRAISFFEAFEVDGLNWHDWIKGAQDRMTRATVKAARDALVLGENRKEAARRLSKEIDVGVKKAEQLIQDSTHGAYNYAEQVYHELNKDLINVYRWSCEFDNMTCPRCGELDGTKWTDVEEVIRPPLHTLCRCRIATSWVGDRWEGDKPARYDDEAELVPRDLNYSDWVQGYAKSSDPAKNAMAKEVLGKHRFDLVRADKIKVEKLYYNGKIPLKDLKRKYDL